MQTENLPNTSQRHYTKLCVTPKFSRSSATTAATTDYKPLQPCSGIICYHSTLTLCAMITHAWWTT